jgi:tRNA-2-methylthio-N6-dimethylallyladenosine synthase
VVRGQIQPLHPRRRRADATLLQRTPQPLVQELLLSLPRLSKDVAGTAPPRPSAAAAIRLPIVRRYHVTTFGCQMNEHDSERMRGMLESIGYTEAASRDQADLILFNTCSIREKADDRFVAHLGEAKRLKREDPNRVIGVGGCWAQSVKDEVFARFPFVDVAFGPGQVHKLAEFLTSDSLTAQGYFEFEGFTGRLPAKRAREYQGWVQISVGCNCVCSYCIVPSTRGREVSRPVSELVDEVRRLAADGVTEVTLLGQNVNSFGRDLPREERATFAELLELVDGVEGIRRIRYTSPHPKDMRADVIKAHAELDALCEHIHLPLQSGSSAVLKRMRRTYTRERYLERVAMIREHVPECALTTDIIVGFPGETEADFEQTLSLAEEVGYDGAFTFIYSPRRETEAAELPDQIPHEIKVARMERLVEVIQRRAHERAQRFVGRTLEVLVEGPSRTDPSRLRGRSRHNKVVNFTGLAAPGEYVDVEVSAATSQTLLGEESILSRAAR